ncbi:MAG: DNRLRE domain-containing protein, partial [Firmicutes bacterium]|nr:DNRLRE domain-containing protein [Bacillota bacterium]
MIVVRLIDASKKFLIFLILFGQLVSLVPQNAFHANATSNTSENDIAIEESTQYQSDVLDISLVPIVDEDESRRTANEKHFRKLDGTYEVAIYDNSVHYYEDGNWKDIDNSLNDNGNYLENKNNSFKTIFPKNLSENKTIGIKSKDYSIDWKVLDISSSSAEYNNAEKKQSLSSELTGINQSVIYKNVRNQVDLQYVLQGSDVKEYIILNEYSEEFSMSFEYTLKNLKLVETDEGIIFFNQANESVFKFDDLFMFDSDKNLSHDVEYEITETKKDTYRITILPNNDWLSEASYPVMIDPTIISTTTTMSITDTYILDSTPSTNYDSSYYMFFGNTALSERYKGLLDFEIPSEIMNQVITYAHLSFSFVYGCPDSESSCSTPNTQLNIYKNTESFDSSTATWYNAPDYDDKVVDYHIVNLNSPFVFDITKPVKEWQSLGIEEVPGFTIVDENEYGALNIVYQNNVSHLVLRPVIKIGYEEPSGLKDYWTYTSQNTGMVGTGYISDYTGNLTWVRNEYELKNELLSLSLSFFHNNYSRSVDIGYGDGWRTNYSIQIKYDSPTGLYYMHKPDGNKIFFMNNECSLVFSDVESCKSIAEDGSRMSLERMTYFGQNESMKITTMSNIEYIFNGAGRLSSIINTKNNHSLMVYYVDTTSLKISYVKDDAENRISLYYNGSRLTQSTLDLKQNDGSLRQVEKRDYFYDTYNNIDYIDYDFRYGNGSNTGWTTDTNNRLQFNFDADNKLLDAYNQKDNFKVQYSYDIKNNV